MRIPYYGVNSSRNCGSVSMQVSIGYFILYNGNQRVDFWLSQRGYLTTIPNVSSYTLLTRNGYELCNSML